MSDETAPPRCVWSSASPSTPTRIDTGAVLTDGTIVLRAPQLDDVPLVEEATKDAYVVDITSLPEVFSREAAVEWLQRQ